jgi:hypothetical protein
MSASVLKIESLITTTPRRDKLRIADDGSYEIIAGAYNVHNYAGEFYRLTDGVRELFSHEGQYSTKVYMGRGKSEYFHPDYSVFKTEKEVRDRANIIMDERVCGIITKVRLVDAGFSERGLNQPNIHYVVINIKPDGPFGSRLEASLNDPTHDSAFSVRAWYDEARNQYNHEVVKIHTHIIGYDFVEDRQGVPVANKSTSLSLESRDVADFTFEDIKNMEELYTGIKQTLSEESEISEIDHLLKMFKRCTSKECLVNHWNLRG